MSTDFKFTDFICYLDDNDKKISGYVDVIDIDNSFVKFVTRQGNLITIPMRRVLKIKQKGDSDE